MKKKARTMLWKSRLPALVGAKQIEENKVIRAPEIAKATGLSKPTIYKWLNPPGTFKVLEPLSVQQLRNYLGCSTDDLVEIVPASEPGADETEE